MEGRRQGARARPMRRGCTSHIAITARENDPYNCPPPSTTTAPLKKTPTTTTAPTAFPQGSTCPARA